MLRQAVLANVSDLHVGSTVALCPPEGIGLEDGGRYIPSKAQEWVYERWVSFWEDFWRTSPKWPHVVVMNGEAIDGDHHQTTQIVGSNILMMEEAATKLLRPIRERCDYFFVTKGTPAHASPGGRSDERVARELEAEKDPDTRQSAFYHLSLMLAGVAFDIAHHVGNDGRPWTRGTAIRSEVAIHMNECAENRLRPADVLIRGHVHKVTDTGVNFPTYGIVSPAWQLKTEFVHRISRNRVASVGGLIFVLENGQWSPRPPVKRYNLKLGATIRR